MTAQEMHAALTASGKEYSAMSWSGFNVFGDAASIKEIARLQHVADSAPARERALREEIDRLSAHHNERCSCGAIF
jgi:hypothetical protein